MRFPKDAPRARVMGALEGLGFRTVRVGKHISMVRDNLDGTITPLTMPNHDRLKGSTLRALCRQSGISRDEFLRAYERG